MAITQLTLWVFTAAFVCCGAAAGAEPLDDAFAAWLTTIGKQPVSYREITTRFLSAAGRDPASYEEAMGRLEKTFRAFVHERGEPEEPRQRLQALADFFFTGEGFQADLDLSQADNLFPDAILRRKRGYCLGLTLILVDLGERMAWPLAAASAPRHIFVRYDSEQDLNLETTLNGSLHAESWYRKRFDLARDDRRELLRVLAPVETAAHLINNHGFVALSQNEYAAARPDFSAALRVSPRLVEARTNRGVLRARTRQFGEALADFNAALKLWPADSALLHNRVNALISLERWRAAAREVEPLVGDEAEVDKLIALVETIRRHLDHQRDWDTIQALTTALNEQRARKSGKVPGLRGTYFRDARLGRAAFERIDSNLSFRWSWDSPGKGVPRDNFSVRWTGWLDIPARDTYTFWLACSDGIRIWIDGRLVVDAWRRANDNITEASIDLTRGLHDFRVEYFESVGESGILLLLTSEKEEKAFDLPRLLFHPLP